MGASSMLFAPLSVRLIYSKLFMGPPYFKEEKLRLVFYIHDNDKLNSTPSASERESVCGGTVYGHRANNEIATDKSTSHTMF